MNLTFTSPLAGTPPRRSTGGDRWLFALGWALLGYTLLSRGFAYWGVPPVFVGEVLLGLGLLVLLRTKSFGALAGMPVVGFVLALLALAVVRTVPYLDTYGFDAPRDAMQIGYALFAFIVAGLLVQRPERLRTLVVRYRTFAVVVLALAWALYLVFKLAETSVPILPWASSARVFEVKGGDLMVHLAGITAFLILGLMRVGPLLAAAVALNAGLVMVSNRGGMLAFFAAVAIALVLRPRGAGPRQSGRLVWAFVFFLAVGLLVGPMAEVHGGSRDLSVQQLVTNVQSVFFRSGSHSLDGTVEWRMLWWEKIWEYTVQGEHFWEGKGFGINLARDDGFLVDPALRSPHNGHMTILARMGVPGLALWLTVVTLWFGSLLLAWNRARKQKQAAWMGVFAFVVAYVAAMLINATFDVFLEGPMGGIWFWTVFGVGLGAVWIHRQMPHVLDDADLRRAVPSSAPGTFPWGGGGRHPERGAAGRPPAPGASASGASAPGAPRPQPVPATGG